MTATEVNGVKVVESTPMKSPLWRPDHEVYFKGTIELMLADGTMTLGCVDCNYTDTKVGRIRMHRNYACMENKARREKVAKPFVGDAKPKEKSGKVPGIWVTRGQEAESTKVSKPTEPPPAADDILAALEAALQPFAGEDKTTKKALADMTAERDHWRSEFKLLTTKMAKIQKMLQDRGILK